MKNTKQRQAIRDWADTQLVTATRSVKETRRMKNLLVNALSVAYSSPVWTGVDLIENAPTFDANTLDCCGVTEIKLEDTYNLGTVRLAQQILLDLASSAAAVIVTQTKKQRRLFKAYSSFLNTITKPISLGVNPNSGNHLTMWVICHGSNAPERLEKFIIKEANRG
jgi:hypothetical protein